MCNNKMSSPPLHSPPPPIESGNESVRTYLNQSILPQLTEALGVMEKVK